MKTRTNIKNNCFLTLIFVLIFSQIIYADQVSDMKNQINKINSEIQQKTKMIKTIDVKKGDISSQIHQIEKEIKQNEVQRVEIMKEIQSVSRNVEYGEKNLELSLKELESKKNQYTAKIISWNKYYLTNKQNLPNKPLIKKHFKEILHGDLKRMSHIETVQGSIIEVTEKIEKERNKLASLEKQLSANASENLKKKQQQSVLMDKLIKEQASHKTSINKLKQEKSRIEKQIAKIIKERSKVDTKVVKKSEAYSKIGKTQMPVSGQIVVYFGQKKSGQVVSNGIEIKSKMGANVVAATGGKVIYADKFQGLGKVVMIDYGYNTIGVYGNLVSTKVSLNSTVSKGQSIGVLGTSTDGQPHLYYELRFKVKPIDPVPTF